MEVCWAAHLHKVVKAVPNLTCEMTNGIAGLDLWEAKPIGFSLGVTVRKLRAIKRPEGSEMTFRAAVATPI